MALSCGFHERCRNLAGLFVYEFESLVVKPFYSSVAVLPYC